MFTKVNNKGQVVMPVNEFFYVKMESDSFRCCDEWQDTIYCFANDVKQGCSFCEFDYSIPCECEKCE